jgi:putative transposase
MGNHFHLIAVPRLPSSLALTLRSLLSECSMRVNVIHHHVRGHLWQSRFYSCALDEDHLWTALRYVELNPVRAHLAERPELYHWSSARYHMGYAPPPGLLQISPWNERFSRETWRETLREASDDSAADELRQCTGTGRPWASPAFLEGLEKQLGRRLLPRPVGRPRGQRGHPDAEVAALARDRQLSFAVDAVGN